MLVVAASEPVSIYGKYNSCTRPAPLSAPPKIDSVPSTYEITNVAIDNLIGHLGFGSSLTCSQASLPKVLSNQGRVRSICRPTSYLLRAPSLTHPRGLAHLRPNQSRDHLLRKTRNLDKVCWGEYGRLSMKKWIINVRMRYRSMLVC